MEIGFLVLLAVSAGTGLLLRKRVSPTVGRVCGALGIGALTLALAILGLTVMGWGPFQALTAGLVSVILFVVAALALPFAVTVTRTRASSRSDAD